jgi:hypothetical protein
MKTARIAIFLTGMIGLGMGGLMSLSSIQSQQEETVLRVNESLKNQAQAYVDQFFSVVEAIKSGGNPYYVLNRFSVKLNQGVPSEIEKANHEDTQEENGHISDLAMEDRLLTALKSQVSINDLKISKISVGTFELSEIGNKEGIYVALAGAPDRNAQINSMDVILMDPNLAMVSFPKLQTASMNRNAFLISKAGKVLAHTSTAFVGTDLRKSEGLKETIEDLFVGAKTGSVGTYHAVDGSRQQVALIRAGTLPFAIGVEQSALTPAFSYAWIQEQMGSGAARKGLGMIFVVMAAALVLFSFINTIFNRSIQNELMAKKVKSRFSTEDFKSPPQFNLHHPVENETINDPSIENAAEEYIYGKTKMQGEFRNLSDAANALSKPQTSQSSELKINVHRDYADELVNRIKQATSSDEIETALTQLTSEISESPTLFFRYNRRLQNLTLGTVAGNINIGNASLFQSYIRKDIEEQIEAFALEGKVASLSNYGPLNKMMITYLNIAHFEAWAITSDSEVSGTPKFVGVLIILNASFRSAQTRPILSRMLKETGNYLFAMNGRVSTRRRSIKPTISSGPELNA